MNPAHAMGCMGQSGRPDRVHAAVEESPNALPSSTVSSRRPTSASTAVFREFISARLLISFTPSTDIYSCPLAMTDGAARTLLASGNQQLIVRAVPHLITAIRRSFGPRASG